MGTIGFTALTIGEKVPAAGQQTISTVNSLQEILGSPQTALATAAETLDAELPTETIAPETAKQAVEIAAAEAVEVQTAVAETVEAIAETAKVQPSAQVKEISQQNEAATAIAANAESLSPITPLQITEAKPVELLEPVAASTVEQPKNKPLPKKASPPQKIRKNKPKKTAKQKKTRRKPSVQPAKTGNSRRNTAGQRNSGASGIRTASPGAIQSYGLQVRSRIVARSPKHIGRGRVLISLGISKRGNLRYVRISNSSGNAEIDRATLRAIRRAAPFPRPPANASLKQLSFKISFTFR